MSVLEEATAVVEGPRGQDYGAPRVNHGCTAELMRAYLIRRYGPGAAFDHRDVCIFNMLQKISRLAHTPGHHDSLVDIAGYARNYEMLSPER